MGHIQEHWEKRKGATNQVCGFSLKRSLFKIGNSSSFYEFKTNISKNDVAFYSIYK